MQIKKNKLYPMIIIGIFLGMIVLNNLNSAMSSDSGLESTNEAQKKVFMYLKIEGQSGAIEGSSTSSGHENWIDVLSYSHSIVQVFDSSTGLPTGKRQHKPFVITKEIDKSSPLLFGALATGQTLPKWSLEFLRLSSSSGTLEHYYTIELSNAKITSIVSTGSNYGATEHVSFIYQKITWTWEDGGIVQTDDWSTTR